MNKKNLLSFSVGIPTCYGGNSLVETAKTIRDSKNVNQDFKFYVVADRTPLTKKVLAGLKKYRVSVTWNNIEGSQHHKLKQLVKKCNEDVFIYTQDDITFHEDTIKKIVDTFEKDPKLTMVSVRRLALPPLNFFESLMGVMMRISDRIARTWNGGQNYFAASGRCLAFRTEHLKKFRILEQIVNGDTYLYFENIRLKGKFSFIKETAISIRSPMKLKDQIGPSSRYQYSYDELQKYFPFDIKSYYKIPFIVLIKSALQELILHPLSFIGYTLILIYTRINRQNKTVVKNPVWAVDSSTKR